MNPYIGNSKSVHHLMQHSQSTILLKFIPTSDFISFPDTPQMAWGVEWGRKDRLPWENKWESPDISWAPDCLRPLTLDQN